MKAAQIQNYSKNIDVQIREVPLPEIADYEVLIQVKAAAVNPLELLILTGSVKLIQDYSMPLTLGNECSGIVEKVGRNVWGIKEGGSRLYQIAPEKNRSVCGICGGGPKRRCSDAGRMGFPYGSFGQVAVPVAKAMGLEVIVIGSGRVREEFLAMGADRYIDYKKENYWETVSGVDHVIDTLGADEFEHELSVLKKGGRLLSLRTGPNQAFALKNHFPPAKRALFAMAGAKYDKAARKQGKEYRFLFVRSDGEQLKAITDIVEKFHIAPTIDPHVFSLDQAGEALKLMAQGATQGKVILRVS